MTAGAARGLATVVTTEMREAARLLEPDRYLAALLAPRQVRDSLVILAAFVAELRRIPHIVSDPNLAEIRLTWWRDALLETGSGATGNPLADATRALIVRYALDRAAFEVWFDALADTFYAGPPEDEAELDLQLGLIEGTPFALAAQICGEKPSAELRVVCAMGGVAYGLVRIGLEFPRSLARGRLDLPGLLPDTAEDLREIDAKTARDIMERLANPRIAAFRREFPKLAKNVRTALLPVALVEPYLRACCNQRHDLTRELAEVAPLTRVWRIWRAHMSGHI